jgi:hypothetical protein
MPTEVRDRLTQSKDKSIGDIRKSMERMIEATQGNFDHISGESSRNVQIFNKFMSEFENSVNDLLEKVADHEARLTAGGL